MISFSNIREEVSPVKNFLRTFKYDLNQNLLTGFPPLSLKNLSLLIISTTLWHKQLKNVDFELLKNRYAWEVLTSHENEIKDKVSKLVIPVDCKDSLNDFLSFVQNEIINFVQSYYNYHHRATTDKLKVFLDNICWTQHGTINYLKTSLQVIKQSDLSIRDKYEIACCCCLEETIQDFLNILPENVIKEIEDDEMPFSLPSFWTSYIRTKELPTLIMGEEARQYLIKFAIKNKCATALPYIWEKFANEEVKERVKEYAELAGIYFSNSVLYFAKQMTLSQLKETSMEVHYVLLIKLYIISINCNLLPLSCYILELTRSKNVYHKYSVITFCWVLGLLENETFLNIWKVFVCHFKSDFDNNLVDIYDQPNSNYLGSMRRNIILTRFLLLMTPPENRSDIIYASRTLDYCVLLIVYYGLKKFNLFLGGILETDEICGFKKRFFKHRSISLFYYLIPTNKYEILDEVLLEFCTKENIKEYKRKFIYDNFNFFFRFETHFRDKEIDLIEEWNKCLSWCFDGDEKEMLICRINAFNIDSIFYNGEFYFNHIRVLTRDRKWKLVEHYWKWLFYSTEEMLTTSEEKLKRIKKILLKIYVEECFLKYMEKAECHKLLKRFIISCFKKNEIMELKEELKTNDDLSLFVRELLKLDELVEANNFINWCYSFDENKMDDFKTTFMKLYGCSLLFDLIRCNICTDKMKSVIEWFNPSIEFANIFKEEFIEYMSNQRKTQIDNNELEEEDFSLESSWGMYNEKLDLTLHLLEVFIEEKVLILDMRQLELVETADKEATEKNN